MERWVSLGVRRWANQTSIRVNIRVRRFGIFGKGRRVIRRWVSVWVQKGPI